MARKKREAINVGIGDGNDVEHTAIVENAANTGELENMFSVASKNLINFRKIILETDSDDEVESPPFHYEWSDILLHGTSNYAIEGYRESAKTSIVQRSFPLYCMTFATPKLSYVVLIKNTTTLARSKIKEIQREYMGNPITSARMVKIIEQSADAFHIVLSTDDGGTMEFRMEAYSKGSSIRGIMYKNKRPDIIIMDDVQDIEDARSDAVCEADWDWFLSDIYFLGRKTRIFMIANNLGDKCIIERVAANPKAYGFKFMRVPVMDADNNPTWPERDKIEDILAERASFDSVGKLSIWMREKMCIAVAEENRVIKESTMCYYHPSLIHNILGSANVYTVIDLATSTKLTNDFTAIVTVAVNPDNHWFVLDCDYGRWAAPEIIDRIIQCVKTWRPRAVGVEKGGLKNVVEPFLRKAMAQHNVFFNLQPIDCKQKKETRVELALAPRFDSQTIHLPETAHWLSELKLELTSLTRDEGFKSLHDDCCFPAGTLIATSCGDKPIETITTDDYVITPIGLSVVTGSACTGRKKVVDKLWFSCTENHPIWDKKSIAFIDAISYNNDSEALSRLTIKEMLLWAYRKLLYSMEKSSDLWVGKKSITYLSQQPIAEEKVLKDFMLRFGSMLIKGRFRKALSFIMLMAIHSIMILRILSVYQGGNMRSYIRKTIKDCVNTWKGYAHLLKHGIALRRVLFGIENMLLKLLGIERKRSGFAMCVGNHINIPIAHQNIALPNVSRKPEFVNVYNISVEHVNCYYANGVLVGNCDALAGIDQIASAPINARVGTNRIAKKLKAKFHLDIF